MHELGTACTRSSECEVFPVYLESTSRNDIERVVMTYISQLEVSMMFRREERKRSEMIASDGFRMFRI